MTITVELPPEVESKIKTQTEQSDFDAESYVQTLIKEAFTQRERIEKMSDMTFDEILAPVRQGFQESGESEDEILAFFEQVREEVWRENQPSK